MRTLNNLEIATNAAVVTPHDTNTQNFAALYVGVLGNVKVDMYGTGTAVVFIGIQGLLPISVSRVYSADTTATDIVGLF